MTTSRLEAFSDGVIAIIITIMVLELHVPHDDSARSLLGLLPVLLSYILSFTTVAIYWINHHHLIHLVQQVSTRLLWMNVHFLFWLSLLPFVTGLLGADVHSSNAAALYGLVAVGCSASYFALRQTVTRQIRPTSTHDERGTEGRPLPGSQCDIGRSVDRLCSPGIRLALDIDRSVLRAARSVLHARRPAGHRLLAAEQDEGAQ